MFLFIHLHFMLHLKFPSVGQQWLFLFNSVILLESKTHIANWPLQSIEVDTNFNWYQLNTNWYQLVSIGINWTLSLNVQHQDGKFGDFLICMTFSMINVYLLIEILCAKQVFSWDSEESQVIAWDMDVGVFYLPNTFFLFLSTDCWQ